MIFQSLIVVVLVVACSVYATWTLMPASARRGLALSLLKLPLHALLARRLRKHAVASSGCGCDGCDRSTAARPTAGAVQPLTFRRPAPRRRD
jgi:ferrous iron transport protein B